LNKIKADENDGVIKIVKIGCKDCLGSLLQRKVDGLVFELYEKYNKRMGVRIIGKVLMGYP
jgi:malonyl CoA-acyl carrier protein transacylase